MNDQEIVTFIDERGSIADIYRHESLGVTVLFCKKGSIRGNHVHQQTSQYCYVVTGGFMVVLETSDAYATRALLPGEAMLIESGVAHAFKALEDSILVAVTEGVRVGMNYEKDTIRLVKKLLE